MIGLRRLKPRLTTSCRCVGMHQIDAAMRLEGRDSETPQRQILCSHNPRMLAELLLKWPLIRQLRGGGEGPCGEAMSERTEGPPPQKESAQLARPHLPYFAGRSGPPIYQR